MEEDRIASATAIENNAAVIDRWMEEDRVIGAATIKRDVEEADYLRAVPLSQPRIVLEYDFNRRFYRNYYKDFLKV